MIFGIFWIQCTLVHILLVLYNILQQRINIFYWLFAYCPGFCLYLEDGLIFFKGHKWMRLFIERLFQTVNLIHFVSVAPTMFQQIHYFHLLQEYNITICNFNSDSSLDIWIYFSFLLHFLDSHFYSHLQVKTLKCKDCLVGVLSHNEQCKL